MIGLGTWKCKIDHSFYKGDALLIIKNKNGEYDFEVELEDNGHFPQYTVSNVKQIGNRLEGELSVKMVPMKMKFYAEFEGDKMHGALTVPFVGEVKLEDAVKID